MDTKNSADHAKYQLKMISELPEGWGDDEEGYKAYDKEFMKYCSSLLEDIVDKFGEDKAPFITPIWNGTAIQMEYEEDEFGYLEFEIHEDNHIEILYVENESISGKTYKRYNEVKCYTNIEEIILDCIKKYFNKNLYNNFLNKGVKEITPNYIIEPISPGETIKDLMEDRHISKSELAVQMYMTETEIEDLLNGNLKITPIISNRLQKVFGVPSSFWQNLQSNYDKEVEKYGLHRSTEESN